MAKVGLVFVPSFPAGHLTAMLEFAKRLLVSSNNHFSITVLLLKPPSHKLSPPSLSYIESLSSSGLDIHFRHLHEVDPPEQTDGPEDFISLYFQLYRPHVKAAIAFSSPIPASAILIDFFATALMDVAQDLSLPAYVYFAPSALMLGLCFYAPTLDVKIPDVEFEEAETDVVVVPGVLSLPTNSLPNPWMNRKNRCYTWMVYHGRRFLEAKGIIVNTFEELQPKLLSALAEGRFLGAGGQVMPKLYPVGPVLSLGAGGGRGGRDSCTIWLDKQPEGSVVFLCFGSNGCFGVRQVREIAAGLEKSGHRFLWCLRRVVLDGDGREIVDANLDQVLPEGFLERTRERGMVWASWAPQIEILSHGAVGGFVTHCGWNSCLEGLWFGVPMLAWPLYAEQHLNRVEMVRDLGVAVGLEADRKGANFVAAEELERGVRRLMGGSAEEGKRARARVREMGAASRKAVQEGGSSYMNLKKLADDLCA